MTMKPTNEQVAAAAEWADGGRGQGRSFGAMAAELRSGGGVMASVSAGQLEGWHRGWSRGEVAAAAEERRKPVAGGRGEDGQELDPYAGAAVDGYEAALVAGEEEAARQVSEDVYKVLRFLAEDLVERVPSWQFACERKLRPGEWYEVRLGPGELAGVSWMGRAVVIFVKELEVRVVAVFPEHRVRGVRDRKMEMQIRTLGDASQMKARGKLDEIKEALGRGLMSPRGRAVMEKQKARLEAQLLEGHEEERVYLRCQRILARLAAVMDLYLPGLTGIRSGTELARATGRSRAAVSAQKLAVVRQDTRRTGGRAGFEGTRAAGRHREKVKGFRVQGSEKAPVPDPRSPSET